MIQRLLDFYKVCPDANCVMSVTWKSVIEAYQGPFIHALQSGNAAKLQLALDHLRETTGTYGVDTTGWGQPIVLGQKAGVLAYQNPEQPSPTGNWNSANLDGVISQVSQVLGIDLAVPDCFGFKMEMPNRFYYYCAIALTIRMHLRGFVPSRVLEIGAGLCNLGLISHRWGSTAYTVIDLPSVAVMGAYFLSKCIGEEHIWLYGESPDSTAFAKFYPATAYDDVRKSRYDLIINTDSFPEIPIACQDQYIELIDTRLAPSGIFVSVNHESDKDGQSGVPAAVARNGNHLMRILRSPFIMRAGYMEEIYKLRP